MADSHPLQITLPYFEARLPELLDSIEKWGEQRNLNPKIIMVLALAAEEIFTNLIHHSVHPPESTILIELLQTNDQVSIAFWDQGEPFDPRNLKDPDLNLDLAERPIGGLGLYLLKHSFDKIDYLVEAGINCLKLTKTLS